MNFLKQIRQQYRLSQTGMAAMLNVSRSHIAMAETGQRDLPVSAITKLSQLGRTNTAALAIARQPVAKWPVNKIAAAQDTVLQKMLNIRLGKLRYKLSATQHKLAAAENLHSKAMDTLLNVSAQHTARSLVTAEHIQQVWLNGMEATARLELHRMPKYKLELLRIKAEALAAEIAIIEKKLAEGFPQVNSV